MREGARSTLPVTFLVPQAALINGFGGDVAPDVFIHTQRSNTADLASSSAASLKDWLHGPPQRLR